MSDDRQQDKPEYEDGDISQRRTLNELRRVRKEMRRVRREARRARRRVQREAAPARYVFWGLMLILWAILIFLYVQHQLTADDLWKAFIVGLGGTFIVQAFFYLVIPSQRSRAIPRIIPGIILVNIGLGFLFGFTTWWPEVLGVAGLAVIFISWFLQREMDTRRTTQETLRESEVKYRHIVDNAGSVIMEVDTEGRVNFINKFARDFFGFSDADILGHSLVGTIVAPGSPAAVAWDSMIKNIAAAPEAYLHDERENRCRDGTPVWMIWSFKPILDDTGNLREMLCTAIDRTQQKKGEKLAAQQMREQTAQEERNRLARDLHDAVSQTLFSASLIAEVLPRVWERNKEEGLKKLQEVRQLTRGALAEMRTLLFELRPAALVDADLNDLLRQLAESVTGRARVPVAVEIDGTADLPTDVKIALYRIAQEALNNIAKHSGASQARVALHRQPGQVTLLIADNGHGFDVSQIGSGSFGLGNMKERAAQIGAVLEVDSHTGQGTEITVVWHENAGEVTPRQRKNA